MKKRLFIYTTLIILAGLLCFFAATVYFTYQNNLRIGKDTIAETAHILSELYDATADPAVFADSGGETRITLISSDGSVIADSSSFDIEQAGNHLDRPEVIAAASGSPAAHIRYSATLGVNYIYYAVRVDAAPGEYVFIRTSIPVAKIDTYLSQSLPMLVLIFCVITIPCFLLARTVINRVVKPLEEVKRNLSLLSEGGYTRLSPSGVYGGFEEIDAIMCEIDDVAQILQQGIKELQEERDKAEYIINNIGDAIFAVNTSKDIVLVNNAALGVFDVTREITGKSVTYLTYDKDLLAAIDDCTSRGEGILSELSHDGKTYILTVKRLENTELVMVILSDITDSRESAKRREEFFDNASHELKTPLTAIKGFNELCAMKNKDGDLDKYIESITRETDRMLSLISDMLRLSELTNKKELSPVSVSLCEAANEVAETLQGIITEKSLHFDIVEGDPGSLDYTVEAESAHVYELLKNLVENAVRYNMPHGSIKVIIGDGNLRVSDTGIGIPLAAQTRLFERFYRVEKSRSIQSGGTGLGLAIVKHICNLYGWNLSLKSRPGVGTDVTVAF